MKNIEVQYITVEEDRHGQRIDNFLFSQFRKIPKTRIYRALRKGEVRVNKKRVDAEYRLNDQDVVRIPPLKVPEKNEIVVHQYSVERIGDSIIYEDDDLLILNKPSGMPVHGGTEVSYGVIDALRKARPQAKCLELAHRLDKETSGCLLIAKKRSVLKVLHEMFRENKVKKEYLCLTKGAWQAGSHRRVEAPLKKNILQSGERMVHVNHEGKYALTEFLAEETFSELTLVRAILHTGRTHQIRVHLQYIHHPIVGDEKYGDKFLNKSLRAKGLFRMFLHAQTLAFTLPGGKRLSVVAPLPDDLEKFLEVL
jgi:23S rRNA pseudouridine955/2504/2580 synthase